MAKTKFLSMRLTDEEYELMTTTATAYEMDVSRFLVTMIKYVSQVRPNLVIVPKPVSNGQHVKNQ